MTEAVITKWLVQPGDTVNEGDPVIEAETDKSTQEIYATEGGIVARLLVDEGQTVECYADIMVLVDEGEEYREEAAEPKKAQGNAPQAGVRRMQLPKIGVNMTEAVITKWLVQPGDTVNEGDPVIEAETDKSTQEIYAAESGIVAKLLADEGQTVECYSDIMVLVDEGVEYKEDDDLCVNGEEPKAQASAPAVSAPDYAAEPAVVPAADVAGTRVRISPLAKKIARESGIDFRLVSPAEPGGRIVKADVLRFLQSGGAAVCAPAGAAVPEAEYEDVALPNIRKVIARSMHASLSEMAQLTHSFSFDATQVMAYRKIVKENAEKFGLANITFNDIILFAVSRVLLNHRDLNAHFLGDKMRYFTDVNLGMAVDTPRGLLVSTIFGANKMSLNEIAGAAKDLAKQAQEGTISPDLLVGASFTVSNLGTYGVEHFTPVINPPQTGILGVNNIQTKLKMVDGEAVPYQAMGISLTYDHRALDGAPASRFAQELCRTLENFMALLAK
jgi:pyruvate dehydrogenase E2 component (dihydrolipoamide acetyltransferase)